MDQLKQLKKELKAITQESIEDNLWFFTKKTGDKKIQFTPCNSF